MKYLLLALTLCVASVGAASFETATITITNTPTDGDSITINGSVRTWKDTVATASSQIGIEATIAENAEAMFDQFAGTPFTTLTLNRDGTTGVTLRSIVGQTITVSISGTWGEYSVASSTVTERFGVSVPFSAHPNQTSASNIVSLIAEGLGTHSETALATGTTLVENLVQVSGAQTIAGAKTFSDDLTASDIYVSNVEITGTITATDTNPAFTLNDSDAAVDNKIVQVTTSDGDFAIEFNNDAESSLTVGFTVNRTGTTVDGASLLWGVFDAPRVLATTDIRSDGTINAGTLLGVGTTNATAPTSLTSGLVITNATTEASADASNGAAIWSYSGQMKYRTSETSEGAGQNNRLHNRGDTATGSGSDYTFTTSYARVTAGVSIAASLPSAGTYLLICRAAIDGGADGDVHNLKLYDATSASDISGSEVTVSNIQTSKRGQAIISLTHTVTAATTIHLYGKNTTSARGTVDSDETKITWVRLF